MPVHENSIKNLRPGKSKYGPGIKTESIRVPVELIPRIKAFIAEYAKLHYSSVQEDASKSET
jgi:hypothetical protein